MLVQLSKRPEFAIVGMKCRVLLPKYWIGATGHEHIIDCPATIVEVRKTDDKVTSILVDIHRSPKYRNSIVDNMLCLATQFDEIFVDTQIEKIREYKKDNITIITEAV